MQLGRRCAGSLGRLRDHRITYYVIGVAHSRAAHREVIMQYRVCRAVNGQDECVAHVKYAEDAAALVSILGEAATVRTPRGRVLWTEGAEVASAGDSYDEAASVIIYRQGQRDTRATVKP